MICARVMRWGVLGLIASFVIGVSSLVGEEAGLVSAKGVISQEKTSLVFDVGPRLVGSKIYLELTIENNTGFDLQLGFKASCGCTSVTDKVLFVKRGEKFSLKPSIVVPLKSEAFSVVVTAHEQRLDLVYKFVISGAASDPFQVEPKMIRLLPTGEQSFKLRLLELFPSESVDKVSLPINGGVVRSRCLSRNSIEVTLNPELIPSQSVSEVVLIEIVGSKGLKRQVTLPVYVSGRKLISPSVVTLRKAGAQFNYFFVLSGVEGDLEKSDLSVSVILSNGSELSGSVDSIKRRAEGAYSIGGSISVEDSAGVEASGFSTGMYLRVVDKKENWFQEVRLVKY